MSFSQTTINTLQANFNQYNLSIKTETDYFSISDSQYTNQEKIFAIIKKSGFYPLVAINPNTGNYTFSFVPYMPQCFSKWPTQHEIWDKIQKEKKSWRGDKIEMNHPLHLYKDRRDYWGENPTSNIPALFKRAVIIPKDLRESSPLAIDLACGPGFLSLLLLKLGWKVIAVDSSKKVLDILLSKNQMQPFIKNEKLTVIQEKMESYQFPENVNLIIANDAFPFCNPSEFKNLWQRAYKALAVGGKILGTLHLAAGNPLILAVMKEMGAWHLKSIKEAEAVLRDQENFDIEICQHRDDKTEEPVTVEFVVKKKAQFSL